MVFEHPPEDFFLFQHTLDSPDLRPISLPMSSHEKALDGMINLQNVNISFPNSNPFAQYAQAPYMAPMPGQYSFSTPYPEGDVEYYSDSDYGYPVDYDTKSVAPVPVIEQILPASVTRKPETGTVSRKRKASPSVDFEQPRQHKKPTIAQVHVQRPEVEYCDLNQRSPYSPYFAGPTLQTANNSPRPSHHYSTSNASQVSLAAPSPHTPAWSPSFTTVKTEHSPRAPMTPVPVMAPASTSCKPSIPTLVRTSTMPQQASPSLGSGITAGITVGINTHTFNPYSMYPQHKASLKLHGDLDSVATNWSDAELEASRKLVVFSRSQNDSAIDAEFRVVPQEEWERGDITVNCIWWKEREEAFVTSVDTISLLEQLVAVRFTVEEKNRIRRNLEGFRPLTVSKAKVDSEGFFKVIMGFPNPKPRNIEKDVKVFPWKILAPALKKIISKYSASYSSTASTLVNPGPQYANAEQPSDYQLVPSPNREVVAHNIPSRMVPATGFEHHMLQNRMPASVTSTAPELSLQVPNMPPSYDVMPPYGLEVMAMPSFPMTLPPHAMTAPIHQQHHTWNFEPFMTAEGAIQMQPASAPVSAYPRVHNDSAEFVMQSPYHPHYQH